MLRCKKFLIRLACIEAIRIGGRLQYIVCPGISLLEGRSIPGYMQANLAERWSQYRRRFRQRIPFDRGILWMQAGLYPLIDTDEGGRFVHANEVIR